ncbi:MAG: DUF115 domain-containing protein [Leptospirales bacterium]|nr:DUF115 domain-containing protein [Leptospirales bacterium]
MNSAASRDLADEQRQLLGLNCSESVEDRGEHSSDLHIAQDASGRWLATAGGRRLHSAHDPQQEARRQLDRALQGRTDGLLVVFGGGLGYILEQAAEMSSLSVIWFEPISELRDHVLSVLDLRQAIASKRLQCLQRWPDDAGLGSLFESTPSSRICYLINRNLAQADSRYQRALQHLERYLNRRDVNQATLARFDRLWMRNLCANLPILAYARPVGRLYGKFEGVCCIVAGAGPSLRDDAARVLSIPGARDRSVLIAADTALQPLLNAGLQPDFVVCVDPQPINRFYLERIPDEVHFIVDPSCAAAALRRLPADRLWFFETPFALARRFSGYCRETVGEVAFGGSVSTNAYDLAVRLGANRVVLIGQDFAFSGGLAHSRGSTLEERLRYTEHRLARRELHNFRQLYALPVRWLPGSAGNGLHSNDKLLIFYHWFQRRIAVDIAAGIRVSNLTSHGAKLEGVPGSTIELEGGREVDRTFLGERFVPLQLDREGWIADLKNVSTELDRLRGIAMQAKALAEFESRRSTAIGLNQLEQYDSELRSHKAGMELASGVMQRAIFQAGVGQQGREEAEVLARSGEFYRSLEASAAFARRYLSLCLKLCSATPDFMAPDR